MNRLKIFLIILIFSLPMMISAQDEPEKEKKKRDHGLTFLVGPGINYHYGAKGGDKTYSDSRFSWQLDGQFGFISTRHQTNRGNFLGVFGSFGSLGSDVLQEVADHAGRDIVIKDKQFNQFFSAEAGMIIFNFIRLSGGLGRQYFEDSRDNYVSSINYFSMTGGLNFNFGAVNLGLNANLLTGDDLAENQLRFSAVIMVKF